MPHERPADVAPESPLPSSPVGPLRHVSRRAGSRWMPLRAAGLLVLLALLAVIGIAASAMAQEAGAGTPADTGAATGAGTGAQPAEPPERIPGSAWLLPVESLRNLEPVTWTIVICSIVAVTLIIQAFVRLRREVVLPEESTQQIEQFISQRQFRELIEFTEQDDAFVSRSLNPALKRAPNFADMREAMEAGVAEETAEQFRRLEYINVLANVGPLLGLLGTVIGIMQAFLEMRKAGGAAEVAQLADGISTALGTTLLGLMLAIPCLVCYAILRNKADRLTQEGALMAEEFLLMMKPGGAAAPAAGGATGPARPAPRTGGPSPAPVPGVGSAAGTAGPAPRPRPPAQQVPPVTAQ